MTINKPSQKDVQFPFKHFSVRFLVSLCCYVLLSVLGFIVLLCIAFYYGFVCIFCLCVREKAGSIDNEINKYVRNPFITNHAASQSTKKKSMFLKTVSLKFCCVRVLMCRNMRYIVLIRRVVCFRYVCYSPIVTAEPVQRAWGKPKETHLELSLDKKNSKICRTLITTTALGCVIQVRPPPHLFLAVCMTAAFFFCEPYPLFCFLVSVLGHFPSSIGDTRVCACPVRFKGKPKKFLKKAVRGKFQHIFVP